MNMHHNFHSLEKKDVKHIGQTLSSTAMKKSNSQDFLQPFILSDHCFSSPPHHPLSKEYPPGPDTAPHSCTAHTDRTAPLGQQPCAAFLCLERPLRKYWPQPYSSLIASGTESKTCWKCVANRAEHTSILRRGRGADTRTPGWPGTGLSSLGDCGTGGPHRTPTRAGISKPAGAISSGSSFWQQEVLCGLLARLAPPGTCGQYSSYRRQMALKAGTLSLPCTSVLLLCWWGCSGTCGQARDTGLTTAQLKEVGRGRDEPNWLKKISYPISQGSLKHPCCQERYISSWPRASLQTSYFNSWYLGHLLYLQPLHHYKQGREKKQQQQQQKKTFTLCQHPRFKEKKKGMQGIGNRQFCEEFAVQATHTLEKFKYMLCTPERQWFLPLSCCILSLIY